MATLLTHAAQRTATSSASFQRYYEEAGPDYAAWSHRFNMHFGFFRWGINPFNRERMLEQMNREILQRLHLKDAPVRVLDMGCGLGATLRSIAGRFPGADLQGITLIPWQVEQGRHMNEMSPAAGCVTLTLGDYEDTMRPSSSFDAVYAIESSCYAAGANKSAFLREAHRLLRPGGRIVVADGFLGPGKLRGPQKHVCRKLCDCWAIHTLGEVVPFLAELERLGFQDILAEKIQARVTPSFLHVPWVTFKFLLMSVVFGKRKMTVARWNNVLAPILLPLVGFPFGPMAYYIISATRG